MRSGWRAWAAAVASTRDVAAVWPTATRASRRPSRAAWSAAHRSARVACSEPSTPTTTQPRRSVDDSGEGEASGVLMSRGSRARRGGGRSRARSPVPMVPSDANADGRGGGRYAPADISLMWGSPEPGSLAATSAIVASSRSWARPARARHAASLVADLRHVAVARVTTGDGLVTQVGSGVGVQDGLGTGRPVLLVQVDGHVPGAGVHGLPRLSSTGHGSRSVRGPTVHAARPLAPAAAGMRHVRQGPSSRDLEAGQDGPRPVLVPSTGAQVALPRCPVPPKDGGAAADRRTEEAWS